MRRTETGPAGAKSTRRADYLRMGTVSGPLPLARWINSFAERLIGSIRRECVDHVIALSEQHLLRVLKSYASYYNSARTHRSLIKMRRSRALFSRSVASCHMPWSVGFITSTPESEFSLHTAGPNAGSNAMM